MPAPQPVQKSFLDHFKHQPTTTQGLVSCFNCDISVQHINWYMTPTHQASQTNQGPHPLFPATAATAPAPPDPNTRPRLQAPVPQNLMSSFKPPDRNKPLRSIEEGTDRIVALFAEETNKMEAHFSSLLSGLEQQLAVERYEKQYWWKRVQELEAELRSLRPTGVDQEEGGLEGKAWSEQHFAQVNADDYPPAPSACQWGNDVTSIAEC